MNTFSCVLGIIFVVAPLIAGSLLKFFPPKKINDLYGIKTKVTSKNQETWDYAHKVCAITLLIYSIFSIAAFAMILIFAKNFLDEHFYLRIVFGLVFALLGVAVAGITTQVKTKAYNNTLTEKT